MFPLVYFFSLLVLVYRHDGRLRHRLEIKALP